MELPTPLLCAVLFICALLVLGLVRRARDAFLGDSAVNPYKHMRHRHRANAHWRPPRHDLARQLLFFATGRRVTTDFLAPLLSWLFLSLLCLAALPRGVTAAVLGVLVNLKNDPLSYVVILSGSYLMQDTVKNVVASLELTTTHIRFDKSDRVVFHAAGQPSGIVRPITSREVVLKTDTGGHCFIPAAVAMGWAVTVFDDDSEEEEVGGGLSPTPGAPRPPRASPPPAPTQGGGEKRE